MLEKADFDFVRRQNRYLVLASLRREGPLARIELVRSTGLSTATITSITADLIAERLIVVASDGDEVATRSRPGRPMTKLSLNATAAMALGIEISVDLVRFALVGYDGNIIEVRQSGIAVYGSDPHTFGRNLAAAAAKFLADRGFASGRLARVAVSVQGIANASSGSIVWSPALAFTNVPICRPLEQQLAVKVTLANDANLMAQALISRDPAAFAGTTAVVFVGRGVGMGLVINGALYGGPTGGAGEFGHMSHIPGGPLCRCGRRGCIEAYAADYSIARRAAGSDPLEPPSITAIAAEQMAELVKRARRGEKAATAAFREAGLALGYGLARAIALVDIQRVLMLGPATRAFELLKPAIDEGLGEGLAAGLSHRVAIERAQVGDDLMIDGLIVALMNDLDRDVIAASSTASTQLETSS